MIVFIQFPFADIRRFVEQAPAKLQKPVWPIPTPGKDFIRSSGQAIRRGEGGLENWVGEDRIIVAKKLLRFSGPIVHQYAAPGDQAPERSLSMRCSGRHFYADGLALAKFELVLVSQPYIQKTPLALEGLIADLLGQEVRIILPCVRETKAQLGEAAKSLSFSFQLASTSTAQLDLAEANPHLVTGRKPILFIELNEDDQALIPKNTRHVTLSSDLGTDIYCWDHKFNQEEFSVWAVRYSEGSIGSSKEARRKLRILVLRLHSEYQVLEHVLTEVANGPQGLKPEPFSPASDQLQRYIRTVSRRISKKTFELLEPEDLEFIEQMVKASFARADPGHYESVLLAIENLDLRPQTEKQANSLLIEEFVMGKNTDDQGASADGQNMDLDSLVKELDRLVKALAEQPAEVRSKLNIELVSTAKEAAKKGNKAKLWEALKRVSVPVLEMAQAIGTDIIVQLLKSAMGLPA